jgi:hypothetical protein
MNDSQDASLAWTRENSAAYGTSPRHPPIANSSTLRLGPPDYRSPGPAGTIDQSGLLDNSIDKVYTMWFLRFGPAMCLSKSSDMSPAWHACNPLDALGPTDAALCKKMLKMKDDPDMCMKAKGRKTESLRIGWRFVSENAVFSRNSRRISSGFEGKSS